MLRILLLTLVLLFTAGAACPAMNLNDGTWSMCELKTKDGYILNLPMRTSLPIGAETPKGTIVKCVPIPAASVPPTSN